MSWNQIEQLRQQQIGILNGGQAEDAHVRAQIHGLLEQLAANGDLDAAAQRSIEEITDMLKACKISRCEAFAMALDGLASSVKQAKGRADTAETLALAWGYLVSDGEQDFFDQGGTRFVHKKLKYRRNHVFRELLDARGNYEQSQHASLAGDDPQLRISSWSNDHSEVEGGPGSGWFPPLAGDPSPKEAKSGKHDHILANAIGTHLISAVAVTIGGAVMGEASTTDKKINSISQKFGSWLGKQRTPEQIGDWIRKNYCTEVNLNGLWEDNGRLVRVDHDLRSGDVRGTYLQEYVCDHRDGTGKVSKTNQDFWGPLKDGVIKGHVNTCIFSRGGPPSGGYGILAADMELTVSADQQTLTGEWTGTDGGKNAMSVSRRTRENCYQTPPDAPYTEGELSGGDSGGDFLRP